MEDQVFSLTFAEEQKTPVEIIVRQGSALPPVPEEVREQVHLSGPIGMPSDYIINRVNEDTDTSNMSVLFDVKNGVLQFRENEGFGSGNIIHGLLKKYDFLREFCINSDGDSTFTNKQICKIFKKFSFLFDSQKDFTDLLIEFAGFKADLAVKIEQSGNDRGQSKNLLGKNVKATISESFKLCCPLYESGPKVTFKVNICYEASGDSVGFWFESTDLTQFYETEGRKMIEEQLARIKEHNEGIALLEVFTK